MPYRPKKREEDNRDIFEKVLDDYALPVGTALGGAVGWRYGKRLLRQAGGPAYRAEGPLVKSAAATLGAAAGSLPGLMARAGGELVQDRKKSRARK